MLQIKDLEVKIKDKIVLENFNLDILDNKIHVIMGPNGVGKSTLSKVIMGNTNYKVTKGDILFNNKSILSLETDERARLGIFLAFQNPLEIEGVTNSEFLRSAINSVNKEQVSLYDFIKEMEKDFNDLKLNKEMMHRSLNTNFSGGEKKKNEILQMKMLKPKLIILDELDSGLDVDSLKIVCDNINNYKKFNGISLIFDKNSFVEIGREIRETNPLSFEGYEEKIEKAKKTSGSSEAVITGFGKINGIKVASAIMDSFFMMGSMGSVVGEKITRLVEKAIQEKLPVILFCVSGGARMQEGIISLMQMAKTSSAIAKLDEAGLLYISVLTDPTTGGVTASFASLGDIILAEPGALIGFAGPRVIEQTIKQKLPEGFQSAEFLLEHGFIDKIVERKDMKNTLYNIVKMHQNH